jgi:hypothetical protein
MAAYKMAACGLAFAEIHLAGSNQSTASKLAG